MSQNIAEINLAIQNAYKALQSGDHLSARRWAERAAQLAPDIEEPWLILASIASPRASVAYIQQALKINPASKRASVGLSWAQDRLRQQALARGGQPAQTARPAVSIPQQAAQAIPPAAPTPLPATQAAPPQRSSAAQKPVYHKQHSSSTILWMLLGSLIVALLMIFTVALAWIAWPGHISKVEAFIAGASSTPLPMPMTFTGQTEASSVPVIDTSTNTATVSPTLRPSLTPTPSRTATPIPSHTPTRKPTKKPTTAPPANGAKRIVVSISQQHLYAYQGDTLVYSFVASTGQNNGTLTGNFSILDKISNAYSQPWGFYMPDWMGIYWAGADLENGIHALPVLNNGQTIWGNEIGKPITYGCVVLQTADANKLFSWASIGTPVQIVR